MKKSILSLLIIFFFILVGSVIAQEPVTDTIHHKDSLLVGKVTRLELQSGDFGEIFKNNYRDYEPDQKVLDQIRDNLYRYDITIVLGTWCSDSKLQVPRFFKILDLLNYNTRKVTLFAVDRQKKCGEIDLSSLNIEYVPTFILYKNGKEAGRIVESPVMSLEKDILSILND